MSQLTLKEVIDEVNVYCNAVFMVTIDVDGVKKNYFFLTEEEAKQFIIEHKKECVK